MLSVREQRFLNRLQKKYKKINFEFVSDGNTQTIAMDGIPLDLVWAPHLDKLVDTCGGMTQVLLDDCISAIKENIAAERKRKREAKKAYLKQNK